MSRGKQVSASNPRWMGTKAWVGDFHFKFDDSNTLSSYLDSLGPSSRSLQHISPNPARCPYGQVPSMKEKTPRLFLPPPLPKNPVLLWWLAEE